MIKLLYQGHASFRMIVNDYVIYIDPYAGTGYELNANLVLITHEHADHNDLSKIKPANNFMIIRSNDLLINGIYKKIKIETINIQSVEAINEFHKNLCCVGYIVEVEGKQFYFSGDTSMTDFMRTSISKMGIDYAFLPTDGIYNMGVQEAIQCAEIIKAKHSVPIHTKPGYLYDYEITKKFCTSSALYLKPNDEIII